PPTPLFEEKGVDLGALDKVMEGLYRPGHFQGVCVVVKKLFDIVKPDRAYFGEKDFQQLVIIKHMVKTLKMRVRIVSCPTVREFDGLAMSSRNVFLTTEERKNVLMIPRTLLRLKTNKQKTSVKELKKWVTDGMINYPFLDMEYFEIVNSETLLPVQDWKEAKKLRACMAVKVGSVRLIDNVPI
ncbi:MAG: 4-phosphopantoate--beta-alanine ligase, partial [Bacteroidetes bacterium]